MVKAKTNQELTKMRKAGIIVALAHRAASAAMQPGITTQELDRIIENVILENGATPSFKGLYGFPAAACISINSVVVHGIPGDTVLCDGDIVSVDIGACYQGYHGDSAWTYGVGKLSEEDQRLMRVSEESLYEGLKMARAGNHLTDISHAIGEYVLRTDIRFQETMQDMVLELLSMKIRQFQILAQQAAASSCRRV